MTMKTPAMMNQYGEMSTGMPNGRATTIPLPTGRLARFSSPLLATNPMLRGYEARHGRGRADPKMSVGASKVSGMDEPVVLLDPPSALSPSRASDFMTCPLLYRFRVIDRLPEPPTEATARGTLVHAVLERLFDRPAPERTPDAAREMLVPEWDRLSADDPELAALFPSDAERRVWLSEATAALDGYFALEDPRRLEPAEREHYVETTLDSGLKLRGYIDRLDISPAGDIRIVDYKTGKVPREAFEASALFQMKFYALVIWRLRDRVPRLLQLMYLSGGEVLRYEPDEADLRATQRKLEALWAAIARARAAGDWRPRPSRLCDWCRHKDLCPEFGGTPPALPKTD
jgi:putative RecB family exonuclease